MVPPSGSLHLRMDWGSAAPPFLRLSVMRVRIEPSLARAADTLCQHPLALGHDALAAGTAAARGAGGAFLDALGRKLQALGVALAPRPKS